MVYLARQIGIEPTEITFYDFTGRTSKAHRTQIREALGFGECGVEGRFRHERHTTPPSCRWGAVR